MDMEFFNVGDHRCLLLTPTSHIRLGRERLDVLRNQPGFSDLDRKILDAVDVSPIPVSALVLRGQNDKGTASWAFDDDLTRKERVELGYLLVRGQVTMWRLLARRGLNLFLKAEWGPVEVDMFEAGVQSVAQELNSAARTEFDMGKQALLELDAWVVTHMSYWLLASFEECKQNFLPRALARMAGRQETVQALFHRVPDSVLRQSIAP